MPAGPGTVSVENQGTKKGPIPAGVVTCKEGCPDSSLDSTWDAPRGFCMKGHGHPAVSYCGVQPEGPLCPWRRQR